MSYLAASDFRSASLAEYCSGLSLGTAEASDTNLGTAITRFAQRFDDYTKDHYESESLTLQFEGDGNRRLLLPKRCTAVTTLKLYDDLGNSTTQTSTHYRLRSSLYSTGSKRLYDLDWIEIVWGAGGLSGYPSGHYDPYAWPCDTNSIEVAGTFGWTTTPGDVKRAVALMVYDHFKPIRADLHRTQSYTTDSAAINLSASEPTGIPEADDIITSYKRITIPAGIA